MLRVRNLEAGYDGVPVLFDVSFEVNEGELVAIVGSNGAGKSTILRAISGLIKPMGGEIEFKGKRIDGQPAHLIVEQGIAHVPEGRHVFGKMTVKDNLLLGAHTVKSEKEVSAALEHVYALFPRLRERESQKGETLSGGEQQMLAIARGLMSRPKILMVDEVSLGLMPILVDKVFETLKEISKAGVTVLMVEQKVQDALAMADRGYVLQTGRIVASGTGRELLNSDLVKRAYMGI